MNYYRACFDVANAISFVNVAEEMSFWAIYEYLYK